MIRFYVSVLAFLIVLPVFPQKVPVQISKSAEARGTEWQILDSGLFPVVTGSDFQNSDSASFGLEENKRYFLEISLLNSYPYDTLLYRLYINGEAILIVRSDLEPGDHFYSFRTDVKQDQTKITGGTSASIADYQWQVFYESGPYTCGGSIIAGDWIITAAHCTEDDAGIEIPAALMDVVVGANNPRSGLDGKTYFVSRVIRHENYNHETMNNDIALLQLKTTISYTNATPIRLVSKIDSANGATDPGVMSWVTGYGLTRVSPPAYPTTLQKVQLPIVSNAQASTIWPTIAPSDMMAGYHSGNKDACNGDSGGPLVVPVDGEYKLAGLVSWGSGNCDTYGAYTRVSLFEKWITDNSGVEISYTPPVPSGDSIVCVGVVSSNYSVPAIANATAYEWELIPSGAGTIAGSSQQATVTWAQGYTGAANIRLRVTKFGFPSYWSYLTVHVAKYNKLTGQSADTTICAGQPVTLSVTSEGYNQKFTWYRGESLVVSGSSPVLRLTNTPVSNTALYRCDISGSCGSDISTNIDLVVLPVTAISSLSPDTKASFGDNVDLEVSAAGHELLYQWLKDGSQLTDGTQPLYTLSNVNASNTGLYNVDVKGTCGQVLSRDVYVYVTENKNSSLTEVFVWPTVTSESFDVAISNDETYRIELYSISGKLMKDMHQCQFKTNISVTSLPEGMYILKVTGKDFSKSFKVIKN